MTNSIRHLTNSFRHLDGLDSSDFVRRTPIFQSQTLNGPFSAVSTRIFAIKYSLESVLTFFADLLSKNSSKKNKKNCQNFEIDEIFRQFVIFGDELDFVSILALNGPVSDGRTELKKRLF